MYMICQLPDSDTVNIRYRILDMILTPIIDMTLTSHILTTEHILITKQYYNS